MEQLKLIIICLFLIACTTHLHAQGTKHYQKATEALAEDNISLAIAEYKLGSKEGDVDCINELAICYLTANGVEFNVEKAKELVYKGYQMKNPFSTILYGYCQIFSEDLKAEDFIRIRPYLIFGYDNIKDRLNELNKDFISRAGTDVAYSYFIEEKYGKSIEWIEKVLKDYPEDPYANGIGSFIYLANEEFDKAVKYAKIADQKDNLYGTFVLGFCQVHGYGIDEDAENGLKKIKKTAEAGIILGGLPYEELGSLYYNGIGTTVNKVKAKECWQKAAEQGSSEARIKLENLF